MMQSILHSRRYVIACDAKYGTASHVSKKICNLFCNHRANSSMAMLIFTRFLLV